MLFTIENIKTNVSQKKFIGILVNSFYANVVFCFDGDYGSISSLMVHWVQAGGYIGIFIVM